MNDQTNSQLLRAYAEKHSEPAFSELVRRHVDFVYSAALRMVCDPHLAEDVTQGVFVALAKNALQLMDRPVLSGWLHRTAQNIAAQTVRTIERRRAREQEAAAMNELLSAEPDIVWEHIAPHLDAALGELNEGDRDALLLRYFERKSAHEMAQTLGISDAAAQKRVSRAVERLREFFAKRGVTVGASGLVVVISANAVQAAPVGLAVTISAAGVLAGTAVVTGATATATKAIAMTTLQKTLITAAVTVFAGVGIYEARQTSQMRVKNETLHQQLANARADNESLSNRLAEASDSQRLSSEQFKELLKLRGEVGMLRQAANELGRIKQENQRLTSQIATQNQQSTQFSTEDVFKLHQMHWTEAMGTLVGAIKTIADKHAGQYPKSFDELKAASDLTQTNLAGNLGFDDFVFLDPGTVDFQGTELILRNRTPIKTPQGILVWVYGYLKNGVPGTIITQELYGK